MHRLAGKRLEQETAKDRTHDRRHCWGGEGVRGQWGRGGGVKRLVFIDWQTEESVKVHRSAAAIGSSCSVHSLRKWQLPWINLAN